jgi:hypothetical protein
MPDPLIGHRLFTNGVRRAVYADADGRQYVLGYDGEKVYGVWLLPEADECDVLVIVDGRELPEIVRAGSHGQRVELAALLGLLLEGRTEVARQPGRHGSSLGNTLWEGAVA